MGEKAMRAWTREGAEDVGLCRKRLSTSLFGERIAGRVTGRVAEEIAGRGTGGGPGAARRVRTPVQRWRGAECGIEMPARPAAPALISGLWVWVAGVGN
jgi:hypothetical protein